MDSGEGTGSEEEEMVMVPFKDCCPVCGEAEGNRMRCGRCGETKYCGADCQKAHWPLHKLVCGPKAKLGPPPASRVYRGPRVAATRAFADGSLEASGDAAKQKAKDLLTNLADPATPPQTKTWILCAEGPFSRDDVFAAGERCSPSVYEVVISLFEEDEARLRGTAGHQDLRDVGRRIALSRYATQITRPSGASADGDIGYHPSSQRRVAALFANGGFLPFLRATREVAMAALELTALIPAPGGGPWCEAPMTIPTHMAPPEVEHARELLRWFCQAINSEAVAHAALNSAPWGEVLEEVQALVDAVMDHEGDANARMEALVYTALGHLDYWAQLPGLLGPDAAPRDLRAELELTELQERMFDAEARPVARAQIAKGRRLSEDECRRITLAHYYLLGQFLIDMDPSMAG